MTVSTSSRILARGLLALALTVLLVVVSVDPAAGGVSAPSQAEVAAGGKPGPSKAGPGGGPKGHTGAGQKGPQPGPPPPGQRGGDDEGVDAVAPTRDPAPVLQVTESPSPTPDPPTFRTGFIDLDPVGPQVPAAPPTGAVPPAAAPTTAPAPAGPSLIERAIDVLPRPALPTMQALPDLPALPTRVPQPQEPTIPLLLVVALAAYALVVVRGDRREPKLARSAVDRGSGGIRFE